jgi:hypothetical protein
MFTITGSECSFISMSSLQLTRRQIKCFYLYFIFREDDYFSLMQTYSCPWSLFVVTNQAKQELSSAFYKMRSDLLPRVLESLRPRPSISIIWENKLRYLANQRHKLRTRQGSGHCLFAPSCSETIVSTTDVNL